ncbi:SUKH-4 family immunity protein [Streptomyces sp. RP5T]|uniref:SUKH-4 family immunity protein n=1 Tax=Streptomyces sp. RP5T TaxID=2490848 RepID=UPI000F654E2E|nr:SUKH-4 family immunity protein [Streptomyces sp. RP5T]RRR77253.1 hypothetical protein EHS43_28800 [Streptomyces sp. RP5T]
MDDVGRGSCPAGVARFAGLWVLPGSPSGEDLRVSQPPPQLPKPEFVLITVEAPPEVPTQIAVDLNKTGIPVGLIGYEYRPLSKPVYFEGIGERGLGAIPTSGLFGRIAVDVASGHVVQIPDVESSTTHHVNRDLGSFSRYIEAVIARFPFYAEGGEERSEEVAEDLRELVSDIDGTPLADNGFWETFCNDVTIGNYADWDA